MKKQGKSRTRSVPRERRIDVTRVEFERLLRQAERNAEAIQRLQLSDDIQLRRAAELQAAIDELRGRINRGNGR
jgi:hypothetical protein